MYVCMHARKMCIYASVSRMVYCICRAQTIVLLNTIRLALDPFTSPLFSSPLLSSLLFSSPLLSSPLLSFPSRASLPHSLPNSVDASFFGLALHFQCNTHAHIYTHSRTHTHTHAHATDRGIFRSHSTSGGNSNRKHGEGCSSVAPVLVAEGVSNCIVFCGWRVSMLLLRSLGGTTIKFFIMGNSSGCRLCYRSYV